MVEETIGSLISEIHQKYPSLRFGQMIFGVLSPLAQVQPLTHDEFDLKIAHHMFFITDNAFKILLRKFLNENHKDGDKS